MMTTQVLFNQLSYIDRLTRGGFSAEQARASAEALETAFTESVATKGDVAEVKHEIAAAEARLKAEFASVRMEMAQSKNDTLRWMFTFNLALVAAIFAIVKFFH
jgi:hypothetical protein